MSPAKRKSDPELRLHKQWLGLLQPVGLVVSPLALVRKQAVVDRDGAVGLQATLRALVDDDDPAGRPAVLRELPALFEELLGWRDDEYLGGDDLPASLELRLPELDELLRPTWAMPDLSPQDDPKAAPGWLLLVQELEPRTPLDRPPKEGGRGWHAPPQAKFERMLRELEVPIGLLSNGETLRLVYAPRGETSGHLSFPVAAMCEVANRPMLGALHMLLSADRLLGEADDRRLPALLEESRKYQNEVSTQLAEQVLGALIELLRGVQAADEAAGGELLRDCAGADPKHVYGGLLTVLLRLVFLLYAEDRGLLPDDPSWAGNYAVVGLFERLREDAGRYPDTMDQRYGAWAWLLSLFRLVFLGGGHGPAIHLPARKGQLFDPDEYPFLEGRPRGAALDPGERLEPPRVSDGTLYRVLRGLLILDGERLSYRSLDVEQIGSVYESMMGYEVERAAGPSIGLGKQHVVVNLAELLAQAPKKRKAWLKEHAELDAKGKTLKAVKAAETPEELVAALQRRVSKRTPTILPKGALYLQPGEERRRTGSHYTPRALTEPIVRTTLRPVLEDLGPRPTPAQILALKVCDPAMGSGAFLVEACRQLAKALVDAWAVHGSDPNIPADEEPLLYAHRLVAEHCLYGVDKNPFAVNLAKLSLWLATLAKDHPFTFLDHALKRGDSLVGLSRKQIAEFRWDDEVADDGPLFARVREQVVAAVEARLKIHAEGEDADAAKRMWNEEAERALDDARLQGDAAIAAFFSESKAKAREKERRRLWGVVQRWHDGDASARAELEEVVRALREEQGVVPFHWELEFPEVFGEGFDCVVGNPPFLGGSKISSLLGATLHDYLLSVNAASHGKSDLVAFFFRRAWTQLARGATLGLISTNSIRQNETRKTSLEWIRRHGGEIYFVRKRHYWPGLAAVVVTIVCLRKQAVVSTADLDGRSADLITAYLLPFGPDTSPAVLTRNAGVVFSGVNPNGKGFVFTEVERQAFLKSSSSSPIEGRLRAYLGSTEMNSTPYAGATRYIAYAEDLSEQQLREQFPELWSHLKNQVYEQRQNSSEKRLREKWWRYSRPASELYETIAGMDEVLVNGRHAPWVTFTFQKSSTIFSDAVSVFADDRRGRFCVLQSRLHEQWVLLQGSSIKDDPRYIPEDCFETFPFPEDWQSNQSLESAGQTYYDYRAALMIRNDEGLTKTYNRFHDPDEDDPEIEKLRELHAAMDRAVLEAYGWRDLAEAARCEFQLEYEEPEDEDEGGRKRRKKKPWRYKWPQELHDEVLARLLELNQEYAERERLAGEAAGGKGKKTSKKKGKRKGAKAKKAGKKKAAQKRGQGEQVPLLDED